MSPGNESIYNVSLSTAAFLHDEPVNILELCSNSALVYQAVASLLYKPSVMRQVPAGIFAMLILVIGAVLISLSVIEPIDGYTTKGGFHQHRSNRRFTELRLFLTAS